MSTLSDVLSGDQATVGLSNTVAMEFGRALFGPVGGTVFAFMVAFSCFGALNGIDSLDSLIYVFTVQRYSSNPRLILYIRAFGICRRPRTIPPCDVWPSAQDPQDTTECDVATGWNYDYVYYNWRWV